MFITANILKDWIRLKDLYVHHSKYIDVMGCDAMGWDGM
jgi:hypothetical protein